MKKKLVILALLIGSALQASELKQNSHVDVVRERLGLEVIESQIGKLLEHSEVLKVFSDQNAKRKFNYIEEERQLKILQNGIREYLDHPVPPLDTYIKDTYYVK